MTTPIYELLRSDLRGRRATLIGLGRRTHVALARYLVGQGAIVRISEQRTVAELVDELALIGGLPIDVRTGGHRDDDVADADFIFVTPAASRDLPVLNRARRLGIPIASEIELVFARCRAPIVGITGSAGKTTTTSLVGEMLRRGGVDVLVGGNIGVPLIEHIDDVRPGARVVLELSSFQLEGLCQSPSVGAILNVTPNHLERHPTFEHYRECKVNLVRFQSSADVAILGADDPVAKSLAERCPGQVRWFSGVTSVTSGAFRRGDELIVRDDAVDTSFARASDLVLTGEHNVLNVLAAAAVARVVGVSPTAIGLAAVEFPGVEHRIEFVRRVSGVGYYNDSIATSPERTIAALRTFSSPIVLIAGGRSKHLPLDELASATVEKARAVVAFGEMADEIADAIRERDRTHRVVVVRTALLQGAVAEARRLAQPGDVVVLSPAGTSFDEFRDFEERGREFKALVRALADDG